MLTDLNFHALFKSYNIMLLMCLTTLINYCMDRFRLETAFRENYENLKYAPNLNLSIRLIFNLKHYSK